MLAFIVPIAALAVMVFVQLIAARFTGLLKSVYAGFMCGAVFVVVCRYFFAAGPLGEALASLVFDLITFGALAYCYFHFINLGQTARRIRLMRELYEKPLSYEELLQKYSAKDIVGVRLARLINNRQIILKDNRYYIGNPSVLLMAKIMTLLKVIFLGRKGEALGENDEK